jgi:hypothetical protein
MLRSAYRPGFLPGPRFNPRDPAVLCGAPLIRNRPRGLTRPSLQAFLNPVPAILSNAEARAIASSAERNP